MIDPAPVQVILPDGTEVLGLLLAPDQLELDYIGTYLELRDVLVVNGTRRPVHGKKMHFEAIEDGQPGESEVHVRIRLGPAEG